VGGGAAITFPFPPEVIDLTLKGEVLEVNEPNLLAFTWGEETLRFELRPRMAGPSSCSSTSCRPAQPRATRPAGTRASIAWQAATLALMTGSHASSVMQPRSSPRSARRKALRPATRAAGRSDTLGLRRAGTERPRTEAINIFSAASVAAPKRRRTPGRGVPQAQLDWPE
jgi:uncharacterized protein YndB with AHSA1/START domain